MLYFISLGSTSLTWNISPTPVPPTLSKLQRQGFTQTLEVVYRILCFMGNEAKHGELSIPLEKGAVVTGIGESSMKKLNKKETAEVARRPVRLRAVHSTNTYLWKTVCYWSSVFPFAFRSTEGRRLLWDQKEVIIVLWWQKLSDKSETNFCEIWDSCGKCFKQTDFNWRKTTVRNKEISLKIEVLWHVTLCLWVNSCARSPYVACL